MRNPIAVRIDLEARAGYVYYRDIAPGGVKRTERAADGVHVDYGAAGELLGIEMLGLDEGVLAAARHFAEEHGLAFPPNLAGATTPA